MKKIILLIGLLASVTAAHVVFGQTTSGVITFEVKINAHRRLPPDAAAMKDRIPEFNYHQDQVTFNSSESLYTTLPDEEEEDEFESEGNDMRIRFRRPQVQYYVDQSKSKRVVQQDFIGKKILIEDSVKIIPWKLSEETKTIQGYICKKATYLNERNQNVIAWYTDKIRPFLGPEGYSSLPGAVLQLDINDGERMLTAKKIELRELKKDEIKIPSSGQRMTEKEFRAMVDEQMKRNGGRVIIRN